VQQHYLLVLKLVPGIAVQEAKQLAVSLESLITIYRRQGMSTLTIIGFRFCDKCGFHIQENLQRVSQSVSKQQESIGQTSIWRIAKYNSPSPLMKQSFGGILSVVHCALPHSFLTTF